SRLLYSAARTLAARELATRAEVFGRVTLARWGLLVLARLYLVLLTLGGVPTLGWARTTFFEPASGEVARAGACDSLREGCSGARVGGANRRPMHRAVRATGEVQWMLMAWAMLP